MFLISAPAKRASLVLMTLFHKIFEETMSAVCVVDVDTVWVFLLRSMVNHNTCVGYCSVLWDFANVSV